MGFWVTTLIFLLAGVAASLFTLLCCNRGPSTNIFAITIWPFTCLATIWDIQNVTIYESLYLFHLTLVTTAVICCWMMYAIVYLSQMKPLINPILSGE